MLKKINKIKGAGIFNDYNADKNLQDFGVFNLVYGWNGSGKTTLSRLLSCLETKLPNPSFPKAEFEILLGDGSILKESSLSSFNSKVLVFNQAFVEENIDWHKQGAKSIVVIAEDNIDKRKRFFELKDKLIPVAKVHADASGTISAASVKEREDFLTSLARSIKQSLQLIDTNDKKYLNYDKAKLRSFIETNEASIADKNSVLNTVDLEQLRQKVRPVQKPEINHSFTDISVLKLEEGERRINALLKTSVASKIIQRLQDDSRLNEWVGKGLQIHNELDSKSCEFCGQTLPDGRLQELEAHFNQEYIELSGKLSQVQLWIDGISVVAEIPDSVEFYEEFQQEYKNAVKDLQNAEENLGDQLKKLGNQIVEKAKNPFNTQFEVTSEMPRIIEEITKARKVVSELVEKHNQKTANFQKELTEHKTKLELHFVAEGLSQKKYPDLMVRIANEGADLEAKQKTVEGLSEELRELEAVLANAKKGAENFNRGLHSFLGRGDISLEYDASQKGYKILRTGTLEVAHNLSEGEKTAIALVYFMIKLTENGNKVEDSIVVIDDPISSFDANHLFHSLAYLKATCEKCKQLFVLTHNFQYFKLVRDWMLKKNDKAKTRAQIFAIEVEKTSPRRSVIMNAHTSLVSFGSEYQYLFKRLTLYSAETKLDLDSSYQVANFSRKLLEGFFSFKHPKGRNDFYQLMEAGCAAGKVDSTTMQKVYKFINQYSHNQVIEFVDSPIDNLLSEGENITLLVLGIIEKCDPAHYAEMQQLCLN